MINKGNSRFDVNSAEVQAVLHGVVPDRQESCRFTDRVSDKLPWERQGAVTWFSCPAQVYLHYMQMNTTQDITNDGPSLDAKIVARMAGLHYQTVLRHVRKGHLKAAKSQSYMIRPEDVRDFISNLPELSRVGPRRAASRMQVKA